MWDLGDRKRINRIGVNYYLFETSKEKDEKQNPIKEEEQ